MRPRLEEGRTMEQMTPATVKDWVDLVQAEYSTIEHREWNGRTYGKTNTAMWEEATQIAPREWREIIRVLAQGGDYYSIQWTSHDGLRPSYRNEEGVTIQC